MQQRRIKPHKNIRPISPIEAVEPAKAPKRAVEKKRKKLKKSVDEEQFFKIDENTEFQVNRCPKCAKDATYVEFDLRAPKKNDIKAWTKIANECEKHGLEFYKNILMIVVEDILGEDIVYIKTIFKLSIYV